MIPLSYITQWSEIAPWVDNKMIEQDLIICRALVSIYNDPFLSEHLAFRGGTALHKLYLNPQPRYSEDIDLVQVNAEPIKETSTTFGTPLPGLANRSSSRRSTTTHYCLKYSLRKSELAKFT